MSFWIQLALALIAIISLVGLVQSRLAQPQLAVSARVTGVPTLEMLDLALVAAGQQLYTTNCALCHGANLQGAADWQAPLKDGSLLPPPLNNTGRAWQYSDMALVRMLSDGRNPGKLSSMPAYGDILQPEEIRALVEFIKSQWDDNVRLVQQQLK